MRQEPPIGIVHLVNPQLTCSRRGRCGHCKPPPGRKTQLAPLVKAGVNPALRVYRVSDRQNRPAHGPAVRFQYPRGKNHATNA